MLCAEGRFSWTHPCLPSPFARDIPTVWSLPLYLLTMSSRSRSYQHLCLWESRRACALGFGTRKYWLVSAFDISFCFQVLGIGYRRPPRLGLSRLSRMCRLTPIDRIFKFAVSTLRYRYHTPSVTGHTAHSTQH
jgi:hypothetical protein